MKEIYRYEQVMHDEVLIVEENDQMFEVNISMTASINNSSVKQLTTISMRLSEISVRELITALTLTPGVKK